MLNLGVGAKHSQQIRGRNLKIWWKIRFKRLHTPEQQLRISVDLHLVGDNHLFQEQLKEPLKNIELHIHK